MSDRDIEEGIRRLAGTHNVDQVNYCNAEVISVNIPARTCDCLVIDGHTEYELPSVRLMAIVDDGILFEPVIGSTVKVIYSRLVEPFVCQYSELENITITTKSTVTVNCDMANILSENIRLGGNRSIVLTDLPAGSKIPGIECLIAGKATAS